MNSEQVKEELQMITGEISDNITYLVYLLLREGSLTFKDCNVSSSDEECQTDYNIGFDIDSIDCWLERLKRV